MQAGLLPSAEAVSSLPSTLVALCLNTGGLAAVREQGVLGMLVPIMTSKRYLKVRPRWGWDSRASRAVVARGRAGQGREGWIVVGWLADGC